MIEKMRKKKEICVRKKERNRCEKERKFEGKKLSSIASMLNEWEWGEKDADHLSYERMICENSSMWIEWKERKEERERNKKKKKEKGE